MRKILLATAASLALFGCSKSDEDDNNGGNQGAATLSAPANNTECLTGTDVSATQNKVTFTWAAADGTETYFIYIKNLVTQSQLQYNAGSATSYEATLTKGTPYSWYVSAKKNSGNSVNSDVWKFYNAGVPVTSHPPFPADLVAPVMSSTVTGTSVTLQWAGSDVDNDIDEYTVYFDTASNPVTVAGTTANQQLANVAVASGSNYYWKVVTTDRAGNKTTSPVFQFRVN